MCPDRHLQGASALGADVTNAKADDAGAIISDVVRGFMDTMKIPNGLSALGYDKNDIPGLVKGALPQVSMKRWRRSIFHLIHFRVLYLGASEQIGSQTTGGRRSARTL